ncbi:MAG TPA: type II toxin-antitoxin system prevent-host-death family antitoxin [Streptomyces sp.]|nr:type II toxin-antitoxin system prevent-host-death family antitoxin [Streptomyces sp.]
MSITASEARKNLFPLIEKVNDDRSPVHITSRNGNAVLLSEEDFSSWQETIYLLRSPANARRLAESVAEAEAGQVAPRELIEVEGSE